MIRNFFPAAVHLHRHLLSHSFFFSFCVTYLLCPNKYNRPRTRLRAHSWWRSWGSSGLPRRCRSRANRCVSLCSRQDCPFCTDALHSCSRPVCLTLNHRFTDNRHLRRPPATNALTLREKQSYPSIIFFLLNPRFFSSSFSSTFTGGLVHQERADCGRRRAPGAKGMR